MKNLYQKKGFLIYWETQDEEQTKLLMDVFRSYDSRDKEGKFVLDEFQKISVAVQTAEQKKASRGCWGTTNFFTICRDSTKGCCGLTRQIGCRTYYLPSRRKRCSS